MKRYLIDLFRLFFPERCAACSGTRPEGTVLFCPACRWDLPTTGYWNRSENPVKAKFDGLLPVEEASAYLFFSRESPYREMIHSFKYQGQWQLCEQLGEEMGEALATSEHYRTIDLIVPIPLHPLRRWKREYNQAEYIARGIARKLNKPIATGCVVRKRYNPSQTSQENREERWKNVHNIFSVRNPEFLSGKRILLVDDLLTTGATLVSCGEAIINQSDKCRISIATLAVSSHELFHRK